MPGNLWLVWASLRQIQTAIVAANAKGIENQGMTPADGAPVWGTITAIRTKRSRSLEK
jgi:hypothetical protein